MPGLVRKSAGGTVLIGLHGANDVRRGFRSLRETLGDRLAAVIVQPMITGGVEVMISVLQEQMFGPLVLFGLGGAAAYVLADRAVRLAPLTDSDADELIRSNRAAPLLLGRPGTPAADLAALRDLLLRISQLARRERRLPDSAPAAGRRAGPNGSAAGRCGCCGRATVYVAVILPSVAVARAAPIRQDRKPPATRRIPNRH